MRNKSQKNHSEGKHAILLNGVKLELEELDREFAKAAEKGKFQRMLDIFEAFANGFGALKIHMASAGLNEDQHWIKTRAWAFDKSESMSQALLAGYNAGRQ